MKNETQLERYKLLKEYIDTHCKEEKVIYGLTKNIKTNNPIQINFIEYKNIWRDVKRCKDWKDKLSLIFGGLTWRPDYFKKEE